MLREMGDGAGVLGHEVVLVLLVAACGALHLVDDCRLEIVRLGLPQPEQLI